MFARPPVSRNGNSAPFPIVPPPSRLRKTRNVRPAVRCRCPTRSRMITASPKRGRALPSAPVNRRRLATKRGAEPRPLSTPPQFPLVLPNARTRNGVGQTVKDLSEDPYAGADVTLTLTAKDEAGNEGRSEPFNVRLPERLFTKPLA